MTTPPQTPAQMPELKPCPEFQDWTNENINEWMQHSHEAQLLARKAFVAGFEQCRCYFKNENGNEIVLCEKCSRLPMHNPPNHRADLAPQTPTAEEVREAVGKLQIMHATIDVVKSKITDQPIDAQSFIEFISVQQSRIDEIEGILKCKM